MTAVGYTGGDPRKLNSTGYTKGDVLAANAAGALTAIPVGPDGDALTAESADPEGVDWITGGGGGGVPPTRRVDTTAPLQGGGDLSANRTLTLDTSGFARFRGEWDAGATYVVGDTVTYQGDLFGALAGSTNVPPFALTDTLTGVPSNLDNSDGGEYEFLTRFTVAKRVRLRAIAFIKAALQTNIPHTCKLWDAALSTTVPLATVTVVGETVNATGTFFAPLLADCLPGRTYTVSYVSGQGPDIGYVYTPADTYPKVTGSVTLTAAGFAQPVGNIGAPVLGTNFWVRPYFEEPSDATWQVLSRPQPLILGSDRIYYAPLAPT